MNIPGNSDDNPGKGNEPEPPEVSEPHVHGVQIDPQSGAYVSDEGEEECFSQSVTILKPSIDPRNHKSNQRANVPIGTKPHADLHIEEG